MDTMARLRLCGKMKNMTRKNGGWNAEDTLKSGGKKKPELGEGWVISHGKGLKGHMVYFNGHPVGGVTSLDYTISAGSIPILKLEIVVPDLRFVNTDK